MWPIYLNTTAVCYLQPAIWIELSLAFQKLFSGDTTCVRARLRLNKWRALVRATLCILYSFRRTQIAEDLVLAQK